MACDGELEECVEDLIDMTEGIIDMLADDESETANKIASCLVATMIEYYGVDTDKCKAVLELINSEVPYGNC